MSKLYLLTGLPFSGKTILRNKLLKRFSAFKVVSIDEIMDKHDMWRKGHPTQKDWDAAYSEAYELLNELLKFGETVIFDSGCLKFSERETPRKIAEKLGVPTSLIYVNTPREVIEQRRNENLVSRVRADLTDKEMQEAYESFEEPRSSENAIIYNEEVDFRAWVKENLFVEF